MRNRHPGTCYRCGKTVEPFGGHFERVRPDRLRALNAPPAASRWLVQHAGCAVLWRDTNHSRWQADEKEKGNG